MLPSPKNPSVHTAKFQTAIMLHESRQMAAAQNICLEILKADRRNLDCLYLLAQISIDCGDLLEAEKVFRKIIKIKPDLWEVHYNLATTLSGLGRHEVAIESYNRVLAAQPDHLEALQNNALSHHQLGRHRDALDKYNHLLKLEQDNAEVWNNRGVTLRALGRHTEALESHRRAITLKPNFAEAHFHTGSILSELGRLDEALAHYKTAILKRPHFPEALSDRGNILLKKGQFSEALASFEDAIKIEPTNAGANLNKALVLLLMERLEEAWEFYEWRKRTLNAPAYPQFSFPLWRGVENISGKRLLIHSEQGLGDTIQFCRYAKLAADRGATVVLAVQDLLVDLIASLDPAIDVVSIKSKHEHFDYFVPLASMPLAFRTTMRDIPSSVPYLHVSDERVEKWRRSIGENGFKIAICWQGSPGHLDEERSFPLTMFRQIANVPNVRLISVQKNAGVEQLSDVPADMRVETLDEDFSFLDTAAVMQVADLVITTDTASAHLAGALSRPAWIVLKHVPDWRWLSEGSSTPWYPTIRVFRQNAPGDWGGAFSEVEKALRKLQVNVSSDRTSSA